MEALSMKMMSSLLL